MDLQTLKITPSWEWPDEASAVFLGVLRDAGAPEADRLLAAELGADLVAMNDRLAEALLSIIQSSNESDQMRAQAAISLGPVLEQADLDGFDDPDEVPISESTFHGIQKKLAELYSDTSLPREVRRRVLEASVRAPQDWHPDAVNSAYTSGDESWKLTAVFCMRSVAGFETQVLEALGSKNPAIVYQAVCAAAEWQLKTAWPKIGPLVTPESTDKQLLLAAIDAVASLRPAEARQILRPLASSRDEDVLDAIQEALAMAEGLLESEAEEDAVLH